MLQAQAPRLASDERVVLMGHGATHHALAAYACLDHMLMTRNLPLLVGAVESYPEIDTVVARLKRDGVRKVHLMPLMLVAGDHAINDMASEEEDLWKTQLANAGITAVPWLQGLGRKSPGATDVCRASAGSVATAGGGGLMQGKLYAIGTGPGSSDLITVRAARLLGTLDVLYAPAGRRGGDSLALSIVREYRGRRLSERHFPG